LSETGADRFLRKPRRVEAENDAAGAILAGRVIDCLVTLIQGLAISVPIENLCLKFGATIFYLSDYKQLFFY
jgi:hypothetical protein